MIDDPFCPGFVQVLYDFPLAGGPDRAHRSVRAMGTDLVTVRIDLDA